MAEPLDYVLMLAEAGLAEMRAQLKDQRPESLETEGLVSALSKQAAQQAQHEIAVATALCDEPDLPLRTKQELYRIAQEAMHNTVKHARASKVALWQGGKVQLLGWQQGPSSGPFLSGIQPALAFTNVHYAQLQLSKVPLLVEASR